MAWPAAATRVTYSALVPAQWIGALTSFSMAYSWTPRGEKRFTASVRNAWYLAMSTGIDDTSLRARRRPVLPLESTVAQQEPVRILRYSSKPSAWAFLATLSTVDQSRWP